MRALLSRGCTFCNTITRNPPLAAMPDATKFPDDCCLRRDHLHARLPRPRRLDLEASHRPHPPRLSREVNPASSKSILLERPAGHAFATRLGFGFEDERRAASGKMLLDAIATVILAAMMFIPLVNIVVGALSEPG